MTETRIELGQFEGKEVLATSVAVTNAGDGLSQALAVDPQILHQGDRGAILLEYEVAKVRFDPVKDTNGLTRIHILKAKTGTLLDLEEAREKLDAQRARIEEAEGVLQLDLDGAAGNGEPQQLKDVLDDAIDLARNAEDTQNRRQSRSQELERHDKAALVEIADRYGIPGRSKMVKAELVDAIVDHEEQNGGDAA